MHLLDTNHCSRLIDGDVTVTARLAAVGKMGVCVSVISRGELSFMVERSEKRHENSVKVAAFLEDIRIIMIEEETAGIYGILKDRLIRHFAPGMTRRREGISIERLGFRENDIWIASTALRHRITVVSADSDFRRIKEAMPDLRHENWMEIPNPHDVSPMEP